MKEADVSGRIALDQELVHHTAANVRQSEVTTLGPMGEAGVVEAKLVEHRRMQGVHRDGIADDVVTEVVGLPEHDAGLKSPARNPGSKGAGVMVATALLDAMDTAPTDIAVPLLSFTTTVVLESGATNGPPLPCRHAPSMSCATPRSRR